MPVPMLELAPQNAAIKAKVLEGLSGLIDRSSFILGENVKGLEAEISAYAGAAHAVGMSSGTDAQLAALMALGIGAGDEVIVPSFTFFATAGVVSRLGAKPVFIDLEPASFNATGALVEAAITPRTKAIMPVHLFGQLADMPGIMAVAKKHGIPVIEDACQSLGAKGWGKSAGQFGDMTAYSFYPTKNLGAFGDAGMTAIRDDAALAGRVRRIRVHGMEPVYMHHEVGMNGRMDEFQALVLRAKLPMLDGWHEGRRRHAAWYLGRMKELTADEVGEFIQFTVRDTGRGIEAERLGTIFDRFSTFSEKSSGLGLALVRRLVESLGGQISVQSRIGQGTTFRISLPVAASVEKHHPVEVG